MTIVLREDPAEEEGEGPRRGEDIAANTGEAPEVATREGGDREGGVIVAMSIRLCLGSGNVCVA